MRENYSRPGDALDRELKEVSQDASSLIDLLNSGVNSKLPPEFPTLQLIDIAQSLCHLSDGTAEGSRSILEYARKRLPSIRRIHIQNEAVETGRLIDDLVPVFPVRRGDHVDLKIRDLITSISTALDEYYRSASEDPEEPIADAGFVGPKQGARAAIEKSLRLDKKIDSAAETVRDTTKPESTRADQLRRQLADSRGLNRIARTELRMPEVFVSWYRKLIEALKAYPRVIRDTASTLKDGADIVEIALERWHEFERNGTKHLIEEFKKTCDAMTAVADKIDKRTTKLQSDSKPNPGEFDSETARAMILTGSKPYEEWTPYITALSFSRKKIQNLSPISGLVYLRKLDLASTPVKELDGLNDLVELEYLDLEETSIANLEPISQLTKLTRLYLGNTKVNDIAPLSGLMRLERLDLRQTKVHDLSPLSRLTNLRGLDVSYTKVEDLKPLKELKNLDWINITDTNVLNTTGVRTGAKIVFRRDEL